MQNVGVTPILENYPIKPLAYDLSSDNYEFESNSWLLPILKKYLKQEPIGLFLDYFFPIISDLDDAIYSKEIEQFTEVENNLEVIYSQVWMLFPKFGRFTKDDIHHIEKIFEIILQVFNQRENVRKYVC